MAITSGFFPSVSGDRKYTNSFLAQWVHSFIGNGVYDGDFAITAGENMSVILPKGQAWINGYYCRNDGNITLPIENADGVLNRKDTVILRWDINTRDISVKVLTGKFASEPTAPEIVRSAEQYDLKLAEINIPAGTTQITQSQITDTRLDNEVCGIVHGIIKQADTTALYKQIQSDLLHFKGDSEADFSTWSEEQKTAFGTWLEGIKTVLDGDTAGNLLNLINEVKTDFNAHTSDTCHIQAGEREKWNAGIVTAKPYTYAELKTLKDNSQLQQGQNYLLTDYVTKYKQPVSNKMKVGQFDLDTATTEQIQQETEPLLLTAISRNEFATQCYSPSYSQDIIEYNFDNNVCGDGTTPRNGFILRRNDTEKNINCPNDWRHIKWARWRNPNKYNLWDIEKQSSALQEFYTFSTYDGNSYYECQKNIHIDDGGRYSKLINTVFICTNKHETSNYPHNISIKSSSINNTFNEGKYILLEHSCRGNLFYLASRVTFGNDCNDNIVKGFNVRFGNGTDECVCDINSYNIKLEQSCRKINLIDARNITIQRGSTVTLEKCYKIYAFMITNVTMISTTQDYLSGLFIKSLADCNLSNINDFHEPRRIWSEYYNWTIERAANGTDYYYWRFSSSRYSGIDVHQIP